MLLATKMRWRSRILILGLGLVIALGAAALAESIAPKMTYVRSLHAVVAESAPEMPTVTHIKTPKVVRAIYMSQCAAGTQTFRTSFLKMLDETELNAIVIDIRDYTGTIAFPTSNPVLKDMASDTCGARDMKAWVQELHDHGVYVVGRITVFQNPAYTKLRPEQAVQKRCSPSTTQRANPAGCGVWKDYKGLSFVDVGAKEYWSTVVELSKESYELGFDELNYDYIRFPSDGDVRSIVYTFDVGKTKQESLEEFFKYLHDSIKALPASTSSQSLRALDGQWVPVISADLFGMTTTNTDDLNIGQVLERALPYFDFINPMVYPSHYPSGFNGYENVNEHPYDIVHFSISEAVRRTVATSTSIASFAYTRIGTSTPLNPSLGEGSGEHSAKLNVVAAIYEKPSYSASKIRPWLQDFDYPVEYTPAMVEAQIKATYDAGLDSWMMWDSANRYDGLSPVLHTLKTD